MKQECVFFHTPKQLEDAEEIFEQNNIEIIFKADEVTFDLIDLTDEERSSLFYEEFTLIDDSIRQLKDRDRDIQFLLRRLEPIQKEVKELQELDRQAGIKKHFVELERYRIKISKLYQRIERSTFRRRISRFDSDYDFGSKNITCKVLIGRVDGNIVRFIEFVGNKDPIVTITGSTANNLKNLLEKNF